MSTKLTYSKITAGAFDLSSNSVITSMMVAGTIPDGCAVRTLFSVDSGTTWNKLTIASGAATFTAAATQAITAASVLADGNTPAELATVTSCAEMAGKVVYIAIAMQSSGTTVPTFGLTINGTVGTSVYTKTLESAETDLGESSTIYDYNLSTAVTNGGTVAVTASLYQTTDGTNYTWSDYISLDTAKGKACTKIKFKAVYNAPTIGTSTAEINHLYVYVKPETAIIIGQNADVISITEDFENEMSYCRLLIKHQKLIDAKINAYVSMTQTTSKRENYVLGTGTGVAQTITLKDTGVDFQHMKLYANTNQLSDFDYNSIDNTITFSAPLDATIMGTYTYGIAVEDWQAMTFGNTQKYTSVSSDSNLYSSTYTYATTGVAKGVSAIRIALQKPAGSVTDAVIGTGTGRTQYIYLDHYARKDTLQFKAGGVTVLPHNYSYDDKTKLLAIVCTKDAAITATYTYDAETPVINGFVAAWNK